ncbi:PAS domain-containing protein [Actinoplanes sp. NEAU-A12]|uniref:PAS domain-containing protein n=1 Tax=Actinoplanes sandaracinus TaxID=3045177 RepID=A0ABT6WEV3_9ACTN|nr:PAS domain-containing protein [Actinoplanes sandaracinus]MDI6098261.1 PAS domain-containing protein [Actinoplanes sandaracinus]
MLTAIVWLLFGAGSVGAILLGVRRHRPARRAPWLLLAGSIAALAVGDVWYEMDQIALADTAYLVMFPLVALSLLQFTRGGALLPDRARLIDLLALACAGLLVVWVFVVSSGGRFPTVSPADVIGALLLIGVAGRLVLADRRNVSAILLLTGAVGMLAGDIAYPLTESRLAESGYVVLYLTWGLAALAPSMVRLTEPRPPEPSPWRFRDTILLAASAATPPLVLIVEALSGPVRNGVVIAVTSAITLLLTITRLADAIHQNSQALTRERALRAANTALVAAADPPAVEEAVRTAVTRLLPANAVRQVILATDDGRLSREGLPPVPPGAGSRSWWAGAADPDERTLICPLRLEPLAVARPSGGALVIAGRREALVAGRDALEVLAGETALALDRITLVEAVGRRDSDLYLRAVTGNTAEIMAVVDADHRIRYASPGLHRLTGGPELPPLTAFDDLVHTDDQETVRRALRAEGDGQVYCALPRLDGTQMLVEVVYRDLRADRLVQGLVLTLRVVGNRGEAVEPAPHHEHLGELPAWVNRRSAQHKFRY